LPLKIGILSCIEKPIFFSGLLIGFSDDFPRAEFAFIFLSQAKNEAAKFRVGKPAFMSTAGKPKKH
jgi:hypothetical protein